MTDSDNYCGVWSLVFFIAFVSGFIISHFKCGKDKSKQSVSNTGDFLMSFIFFYTLFGLFSRKKDE